MKQYFIPALRISILSFWLFVLMYSLIVLGFAQLSPENGEGKVAKLNGKVVGFENEGQVFKQPYYFQGRPSAVNYNGAGSGGSNKGPSNPDYLREVQSRIDSLLVHNPAITKNQIPADLVTASGSGLDPHISIQSAIIQVKRIAKERQIPAEKIIALIKEQTEQPLLGFIGPQKLNVLNLNLALDQINNTTK